VEGRGRARTQRSVHGDANRTQIWAAFASPRTGRRKCVGPLGWVFPDPGQKTGRIKRPRTVSVGSLKMPLVAYVLKSPKKSTEKNIKVGMRIHYGRYICKKIRYVLGYRKRNFGKK
jgi:hypothetical protein